MLRLGLQLSFLRQTFLGNSVVRVSFGVSLTVMVPGPPALQLPLGKDLRFFLAPPVPLASPRESENWGSANPEGWVLRSARACELRRAGLWVGPVVGNEKSNF